MADIVRLSVVFTADSLDGGWVADAVDMPGCMSQGETIGEAAVNIMDAAEGWLAAQANPVRSLRGQR